MTGKLFGSSGLLSILTLRVSYVECDSHVSARAGEVHVRHVGSRCSRATLGAYSGCAGRHLQRSPHVGTATCVGSDLDLGAGRPRQGFVH